jgi:predicted porin
MKKSLFAIAAVTAFAGAAQAQSSVTVYGILDVGYVSQTSRNAGTAGTTGANTPIAYGATTTNSSGFASSAQTTSRLGFRGREDLGGGLAAVFTFETGLNPNNSTMSAFNNRQAFVGLSKKGIGTGSIGTQYTPIHEAVGATDAGQQNNLPGNVIYPLFQSVNGQNGTNTAAGLAGSGAGQYAAANAPNAILARGGPSGAADGYTIRSNNMLKFVSDRFAGVGVKAFYTQASTTTNQTSTVVGGDTVTAGGPTDNTGYGLGLDYSWKKLLVTANFQNFKQRSGALVSSNTATGDAGLNVIGTTSNLNAMNNNDDQMYVGATYDFGILKAYAQYISRKASATYDNGQYVKRTAQQIGVRGFVSPKVEGFASVGTGKVTNSYAVGVAGNSVATQTVGASFSGWQLGSNYWLSKRTNLYAIYGISQTGNAVYSLQVNGSTAGNNAVSSNISAYALGVRHTF